MIVEPPRCDKIVVSRLAGPVCAGALMPLALNLARRACIGGQPLIDFAHLLAMTEPDLETTLREFREYLARSYELRNKIAARVGVRQPTLSGWLAAKHCLNVRSLAKLRAF